MKRKNNRFLKLEDLYCWSLLLEQFDTKLIEAAELLIKIEQLITWVSLNCHDKSIAGSAGRPEQSTSAGHTRGVQIVLGVSLGKQSNIFFCRDEHGKDRTCYLPPAANAYGEINVTAKHRAAGCDSRQRRDRESARRASRSGVDRDRG